MSAQLTGTSRAGTVLHLGGLPAYWAAKDTRCIGVMGTMGEFDEFGTLLREQREAKKWSQKAFGRNMALMSKGLGRPMSDVDVSTASSWENGHRLPQPWNAYVLCNLFDVGPEALALHDVLTPPLLDEFGESVRRWKALVSAREGAGGMERSAYDVIADRVETTVGGPNPDFERLAFILHATRRLDAPAVEDLRRLTEWYVSSRAAVAPRLMLPPLHAHLTTLRTVLPFAESDTLRREVVMMAGMTAVAAGGAWHTLHDYGEAQAAYRFALDLAQECGESSIRAMALTAKSLLYTNRLHGEDEGIPSGVGRSLQLLREAEAAAGVASMPELRLWLYSVRSYQHAAMNDSQAAGRDLDAAQRAFSQLATRPSGFYSPWDENYLRVCRGKVHMLLGEMPAAVRWFQEAVESPSAGLTAAFFTVQLAMAHVRSQELEKAGSLLVDTVDIALATGMTMLLRRILRLTNVELAEYGDHPTVRVLRERLEAQGAD